MANFKIVVDSSCDWSLEELQQADIDLVSILVSFDTVNYQKELLDLSIERFYEIITTQDVFPKTTLPPIQEYIDIFKKNIENGHDKIICVCLSSFLSGTYQAAVTAKGVVLEDHPDAVIEIVDSANATAGFGLLVYELVRMRDDQLNIHTAAATLERIRAKSKTAFTVDSLEYLYKGGRIGRVSAFAGELLNIKPVIKLENGQLFPTNKVRGKKKALSEIIDYILKETKDHRDDYIYTIIYGTELEDARSMQRVLENEHGYTFVEKNFRVGISIASHTGPTALAVAFFPKYDRH